MSFFFPSFYFLNYGNAKNSRSGIRPISSKMKNTKCRGNSRSTHFTLRLSNQARTSTFGISLLPKDAPNWVKKKNEKKG